jgi:DNA (cytosine-5)-methyltransferase 1
MRWDLEKEMKTFEFPSKDKMIEELQAKNLGYDFQKGKHTITNRIPLTKLKRYYIADKLSNNLGDISKVESLPHVDIVVHSSPCQSFSCAGKGAGGDEGSGTTSSLMWESLRLIATSMPKYILWENVANVLSDKHRHNFIKYLEKLTELGYESAFDLLNSKQYGVPQNRLRIFCISKKIDNTEENIGDASTSSSKQVENVIKEIKNNPNIKLWAGYKFPEVVPLKLRLKDVLEKNVEEKHYLSDERIEKILKSATMQKKDDEPQVLRAERTEYGKAIRKQYESGEINEKIGNMKELRPRTDGVANTITTLLKDNYVVEPIIIEDFYQNRNPRLYETTAPTLRSERIGLKVAVEYPCSTRGKQVASAIRASIYKQGARNLEENVVNGLGYEGVIETENPKWRIRKLTTKECARLMNFTDKDHDAMAQYVSDSAIYKQCGNSIVVACLIAIMSSLFIENGYKSEIWTKYRLSYDN